MLSLVEGKENAELELTEGLKDVKSLEMIDFQCNDLQDKHTGALVQLICAQSTLKDSLKWKLALRNSDKLNIPKIGIKCLVLSRNSLGNKFAEKLASTLVSDEYIKSICLKKNKISHEGFKVLAEAVC